MKKHLGFYGLISVILLACACFFAFSGSGEYEYEGEAGDPDTLGVETTPGAYGNVTIIEINPYEGLPADETLDEEFDLLDDESWHWFNRLNCYVLMDGNGCLHYGKSQT